MNDSKIDKYLIGQKYIYLYNMNPSNIENNFGNYVQNYYNMRENLIKERYQKENELVINKTLMDVRKKHDLYRYQRRYKSHILTFILFVLKYLFFDVNIYDIIILILCNIIIYNHFSSLFEKLNLSRKI